MKKQDLIKQLANRINQPHVIESWINKIEKASYNKGYKDAESKQCDIDDVSKRYDDSKYAPPFRVGRKQGKAVLDATGREVIFFSDSEEQARMYCDYLNDGC